MITENGNESVLEEAHRLTHGARNVDYGHPLDDYTRTAAIVSAMLAHKLKAPLTAHETALIMVCVKLSREMNAQKRDNRVDGAGYFWVADQCLQEAERRAEKSAQYIPLKDGTIPAVVESVREALTGSTAKVDIHKAPWLCQRATWCVRPNGHPFECVGHDHVTAG